MGRMQDLYGQLWKEYALSDSRYLTQDAFVLCMETVTAASPCLPNTLRAHTNVATTGVLGPPFVPDRLPHRHRPPAALLPAARRLARPVLRRRPVLRDLAVRPLHPRRCLQPPRGRLLLGLLRAHERLLDRHPWISDVPEHRRDCACFPRCQRRLEAAAEGPADGLLQEEGVEGGGGFGEWLEQGVLEGQWRQAHTGWGVR